MVGGTATVSHSLDIIPLLWKLHEAPIFWIRMATRFVPLATVGGRPRSIITGNVKREPPPAITFRVPATRPTTNRSNVVNKKSGNVCVLGGSVRNGYTIGAVRPVSSTCAQLVQCQPCNVGSSPGATIAASLKSPCHSIDCSTSVRKLRDLRRMVRRLGSKSSGRVIRRSSCWKYLN